MSQRNLVFVYGTLKQGYRNNRLLSDSVFLGNVKTTKPYNLKDGSFPFLLDDETCKNRPVKGELYEVNNKTLENLDYLEGVSRGFYERNEINIFGTHIDAFGVQTKFCEKAWAYFATENTKESIIYRPNCKEIKGEFIWM